MTEAEVTEAFLVATALQGESSYWFALPRGGRKLPENWTSANCFWLYPVEHDLARFADVPGFNPTDSVYELEPAGVSKVLPSATLKFNVPTKKCVMGKATFFFIPAEEIDWVEREYKAMLRREAEREAEEAAARATAHSSVKTTEPPADGDASKLNEMSGTSAEERTASPASADHSETAAKTNGHADEGPAQPAGGSEDGSDEEDDDSEEERSEETEARSRTLHSRARSSRVKAYFGASHRRLTPHTGTTVYTPNSTTTPVGKHKSNEAFTWTSAYVVHRGSADFLCPEQTGNTYGFRLCKVTHNGFPVFLLFGSSTNNAEAVEMSANGVAAQETAVLHGEGGDRGLGNTVMVITRPVTDRHRAVRDDATETTASASAARARDTRQRQRRRTGGASRSTGGVKTEEALDDSDEEDAESETASSSAGEDHDAGDQQTRRAKGRRVAPSTKEGPASGQGARKKARKEEEPLQASSVNLWTDVTQAAPDVELLSRQHPFAHDTTTPLRTTVFSDGTCVTYSAASAEKAVQKVEKKGSRLGGGNSSPKTTEDVSSTRLGGNSPDDDAIRSLLENVQLAQMQNQLANEPKQS